MLGIKSNERKMWPKVDFFFRFCPSVFLYLSSVVPSIWLLEFDKLDRRLEEREGPNISLSALNTTEELSEIGVSLFILEFNRQLIGNIF